MEAYVESRVGEGAWSALETLGPRNLYAKNQVVYLQGEHAVGFYYLAAGRVRLFLSSPDGMEKTLTFCEPGGIFGEAAYFDEMPRMSCARTEEKSVIIPVDRSALRGLFQNDPELALRLLRYMALRVRLLSAQVDSMTFLQADRRIARLLLNLGREDPQGTLTVRATHEELGSLAGVSRITASRTLGAFVRQGLIATRYRSIAVLRRRELEAFAFSQGEAPVAGMNEV